MTSAGRIGIRPGAATIGAALLSAASVLYPPPASADPADDAFIAALQKRGIVLATPSAAIAAGHAACAGLDKGQTPTAVALSLTKATGLEAHGTSFIIGAAVSTYCPQYTRDIANSGS